MYTHFINVQKVLVLMYLILLKNATVYSFRQNSPPRQKCNTFYTFEFKC